LYTAKNSNTKDIVAILALTA